MNIGPWDYEIDEQTHDKWLVRDEETDLRNVVAEVLKTGDEDYDNEVVARNVRLIACAPEILDAANHAKAWIEAYGPTDKPGYTDICMEIADLRNKVHGE